MSNQQNDEILARLYDEAYEELRPDYIFRDRDTYCTTLQLIWQSNAGRMTMTNIWKMVMDWRYNPLSHIPDMNTRHMVMQVLAWMWCIIFSMWVGSVVAFGISAIAHAMLIAGIFITAGVFETAKRRPQYFGGLGRGNGGEHE